MNEVITSPAAQVIIALIPIVGIVIGGIIVFFYLLWRNSQLKMIIKMGNYKPSNFNFPAFCLLCGILLSGIGFVLTFLIGIVEGFASYPVLGGLIPLVLGIGLIIFYRIYKKYFLGK